MEWNHHDPRQEESAGDQSDTDNEDTKVVNSNAGRWTNQEHQAFLEALKLFGKNWSKVHKHIGTRTSAQTRSHAQKYFKKLERRGTMEALFELQVMNKKRASK